ncbi:MULTISPECIES: SDR family NAD(P)-dependent oxidoreductase [Frankia]|uniref:Short chain dehydrogenase/reductase n=1 Tax=Frankia alni (strain DSM 45986 / CECT 9034 / ACN14a) TaxID=326424 RepID=Q0RLQ3_FRAAA|nr:MULTISPECIES: SDR family oxidoreductase [Frankia]CAJ61551.1 putative short chain dehydrogenase/reductase [Frankia alni ACN14a]
MPSPLRPYQFAAATAVVTGAASGLGEEMAYELAGRGSNLVLLDRDAPRLAAVAARICARHPRLLVDCLTVDLADADAVDAAATRVLAEHPGVSLLVNNAGVALGGGFEHLTLEEFDWVMDINFRAPVRLTRLLLPALLASPGSHIVNVSSLFGLIGPPGQTAYSASKFAVRGFTDALRHELAGRVGVTAVFPGGVRTRLAETARVARAVPSHEAEAGRREFAKMLSYPADAAAREILAAVEARRGRVVITRQARTIDAVARLFPASHMSILGYVLTRAARLTVSARPAPASPASPTPEGAGPTVPVPTVPIPGGPVPTIPAAGSPAAGSPVTGSEATTG